MPIFEPGPFLGAQESAYRIEKSLRFRSSASAYLSRTPASTGNRQKFTWSGWLKRGAISQRVGLFAQRASDTPGFNFEIQSDNTIGVFSSGDSGAFTVSTTPVYRDPSAWYHIVLSVDTTLASGRCVVYVNNVSQTLATNTTTQNYNTGINTTNQHEIGRLGASALSPLDGYLADINFIDGQALTPSSFGETDATTGVWKPKAYTGTYGTNGFYLKFTDVGATSGSNTGYGQDFSGNANRWTTNNFGTTSTGASAPSYDSMWDTPTPYDNGGNGVGNYCVLNPLDKGAVDISAANLTFQRTSSTADWEHSRATFQIPSSGKLYWEMTFNSGSTDGCAVGVCPSTFSLSSDFAGGTYANVYAWLTVPLLMSNNSSSTYGTSPSAGDVIMCAFDRDNNAIYFGRNGTWFNSGNPATQTNPAATSIPANMFPFCGSRSTGNGSVNFGQRPFAHPPPSGFKALNTQNLPTPTIAAGDDYFNVILYTGTGASNARTGVGFQPDLVWIKERNAAADHGLYDAVRGVQKQLESNTTTDETTETTGLTAFDPDGFTVGALAQLNTNNDTYVAWNWKESAAAGFDIVTYTGNGTARTISHNLNATPDMIIVKARTTASTDQGWPVYHSANTAAPATDYLMLNTTAATADLDTVWNDTLPTASVFSVGTNALVNANNDTYVAYLWSAVAGYSAFGSYTGNGSADGPFVFTGFRPRYVIVKRTDATSDWRVRDTSRSPYNATQEALMANLSNAEDTGSNVVDILSNGFKMRDAGAFNTSSATYIYAAFAENPFKYALAR